MKYLLTTVLALAAPCGVRAEEAKVDGGRLARQVAAFLEPGTFVVAHADLSRVDPDKLAARAAAVAGVDPRALAFLASEHDRKRLKDLREAGARDVFLAYGLDDLIVKGGTMIFPLAEGADGKAIAKLMGGKGRTEQADGAVLVGDAQTLERLARNKPAARPELADALAAAGDGVVQVVLLLPADLRRALQESLPELPAELGGGKMKTYTRGLKWAALGIDADKTQVRLTIACTDAAAAADLEASLGRLLQALAGSRQVQQLFPGADKLVPRLTPKAAGDRLSLTLNDKALAEIVRPYVPPVREAARRTRSTNNLKQILLALHNYHDANGRFPAPASLDKQGKPLLSWRVHLLPYLDELALYKEFHLDEPWDSEHNKKLIERMPKVFDSTSEQKKAKAGLTTYLGPRGVDTMFAGKEGLRIADVLDGTSNTIFLVDADDAHAVPWTKPEDLPWDPKEPAKGLSERFGNGYLVGLVDASVHFLPKKIAPDVLKALFTRNGGEVANIP
jgi:hypothetical protein